MKPLRLSPIFIVTIVLAVALTGCRNLLKSATIPSTTSPSKDIATIQDKSLTSSLRQTSTSSFLIGNQVTLDGRSDPFVLLPVELWAKDQATNLSTTTEPIESTIPTPEPEFKGILYGIVMSDPPIAFVEEDGNYHKVMVGDTFVGGKITAITDDSLIVIRGEKRLIIGLGE